MEIITALLCIAGLCSAYGYAEIYLDKKVSILLFALSSFGNPESAKRVVLDLMHKDQRYIRGFAFATITWIGYEMGLHIISSSLLTISLLWASIDLICNLWWLKKKWNYIGSTSSTDKILNKVWVNWGLKFTLLICGIVVEILA